mgnify:CR=1 FL=1
MPWQTYGAGNAERAVVRGEVEAYAIYGGVPARRIGDRLLLLDTASLYFRAFYGVPTSVTTPDGRPINAVRGFLDMTARLLTAHGPDRLVACWDDDWRPAFRVEALPTYKTHRVAEVVALKVLHPSLIRDPSVVERFRREAQLAGRGLELLGRRLAGPERLDGLLELAAAPDARVAEHGPGGKRGADGRSDRVLGRGGYGSGHDRNLLLVRRTGQTGVPCVAALVVGREVPVTHGPLARSGTSGAAAALALAHCTRPRPRRRCACRS